MYELKNRRGEIIYSSEKVSSPIEALFEEDFPRKDGRADLCDANLRYADLRYANLCDANLRYANLYGVDLRDANLRYANLYGADLRGARLNWNSHDLLAEVLIQRSGRDISKLEVAGLVLICRDIRWQEFVRLDKPKEIKDWAMGTFAQYVGEDKTGVPAELLDWIEEQKGNKSK